MVAQVHRPKWSVANGLVGHSDRSTHNYQEITRRINARFEAKPLFELLKAVP